jgi:DNA repair exonuclease SbcCD ATPase subunit
MDPFSIIVGVAGLLQISVQLSKYVKAVLETAASYEGNIENLLHEIEELESVNKLIEQLHQRESDNYSYRQEEPLRQDLTAWQITLKILEDCSETLKKLQTVLADITGKNGTGHRDGFKKKFRMQTKESELDKIRLKLSIHRASLNMSLTLLNL